MAFIQSSDGTTIFYRDHGAGKPVVLIHGWCINCDSWEYVMGELPHHGIRCIAYDQRGCGRSDQPWTGYDYDRLADDLASLLESLDLTEATLVGHSMGCGVIVRYLARHGKKRVARAVLVSTPTPFVQKTDDNPDGFDPVFYKGMIAALKKDRPDYIRSLTEAFFGVDGPAVSQGMKDWAFGLTLQAAPQAALEMCATYFKTDQREELKSIDVPVLLIHGSADQSTPLEITGKKTHDMIPGSRLLVYEGEAHGLYITAAHRLNADLLDFIGPTA
ncbi:MAG: alpha/beta hydrolase [Verrucomicrobiota bacterium]